MSLDAKKEQNQQTSEAAKKKYEEGKIEESEALFLQSIDEVTEIIRLLGSTCAKELLPYQEMLGYIQGNVAFINYQLKNYGKSSSYFFKRLVTLKAMPGWEDNYDVFLVCYKIADSNKMLGDTIRLVNPDEARLYYTVALDYYKQGLALRNKVCPVTGEDMAVRYKDIGNIYVILGDLESAELYFIKCLTIRKDLYSQYKFYGFFVSGRLELMRELKEIHKILGEFYENKKDYIKSLEHYEEVYILSKDEEMSEVLARIKRLIEETELSDHNNDRAEGDVNDQEAGGTEDNKASDAGEETDAVTPEEAILPSEESRYNSENIKQEKTSQDQNTDQDNLQLDNVFLKNIYAWLEQLPEWMQKIMLDSAPVKSAIESSEQEAAMYNQKHMLLIDTTEKTVSETEDSVSGVRDDKAIMKPIENMFDTSMMLSDPSFNYQVILPVAGMASDQMLNPANALDMGNFGIFG